MRFGNILIHSPNRAGIITVVKKLRDHYGFTKSEVDSINWLDSDVMEACGYEYHKATQMWIANGFNDRGIKTQGVPNDD